jgi:hypothetical protein
MAANAISACQSGKPFTNTGTGSRADNPVDSDGQQHGYNNRATPLNNEGQDRRNQIKNQIPREYQFALKVQL